MKGGIRNTLIGLNTRFYLKHTNEKDYQDAQKAPNSDGEN